MFEIAPETREGMSAPSYPTTALAPPGAHCVQERGQSEADGAQPTALASLFSERMVETLHHLGPELGTMG